MSAHGDRQGKPKGVSSPQAAGSGSALTDQFRIASESETHDRSPACRNHPPPHAPTRPPDNPDLRAAEWTELERLLREGSATTWLSVPTPHGVHVRPLFAGGPA